MPPTFLLADLYATSALAGGAHSALPGAPVQPHSLRRRRVRHLTTAIRGRLLAVTSSSSGAECRPCADRVHGSTRQAAVPLRVNRAPR